MYLKFDKKGRLLVPAHIRKKMGFGERAKVEERENRLIIYASKSVGAQVLELAGSLNTGKRYTAGELDELIEREAMKQID